MNFQKIKKNFFGKTNFEHFWKKVYLKNDGHTVQNDGPTMQNVGRTTHNVSHNTLNVCQGPKGGLMCPQGPPPTPILEKTFVSRNDF